jgi:hypothetical protein
MWTRFSPLIEEITESGTPTTAPASGDVATKSSGSWTSAAHRETSHWSGAKYPSERERHNSLI